MAKFKFELNRSGVAELLKGSEMAKITSEYGIQVQSACGGVGSVGAEEFKSETAVRGTRVVTTVSADSAHAYHSNMKYNTLLKALGSVR